MRVAVVMGSLSDLPKLESMIEILKSYDVKTDVRCLSAHRAHGKLIEFIEEVNKNGTSVIIAAAGMAAHLPGVIAASTTVPVIGVPIKSTLEGMDALLAIVQMPPGIPVATVGINAAQNAGILAVQMLALGDADLAARFAAFKEGLKRKIEKANEELKTVSYEYKV